LEAETLDIARQNNPKFNQREKSKIASNRRRLTSWSLVNTNEFQPTSIPYVSFFSLSNGPINRETNKFRRWID
jgi:hypothetical protein